MDMTPNKEGFFWGRWHTPAAGTAEDCCCGTIWEVHEVWCADLHGESLLVSVPGVETSQPLDAFEWGEEVIRPPYALRKSTPQPTDSRPHGAAGQLEEN